MEKEDQKIHTYERMSQLLLVTGIRKGEVNQMKVNIEGVDKSKKSRKYFLKSLHHLEDNNHLKITESI